MAQEGWDVVTVREDLIPEIDAFRQSFEPKWSRGDVVASAFRFYRAHRSEPQEREIVEAGAEAVLNLLLAAYPEIRPRMEEPVDPEKREIMRLVGIPTFEEALVDALRGLVKSARARQRERD